MKKDTEKLKRKSVKEFFDSLTAESDFIYTLGFTKAFKKDINSCYKQNLDLNILEEVIKKLARNEKLSEKYKVHKLRGYELKNNEKVMECHILPDWLLIWVQNDKELILVFTDTGAHSYLFDM
jgi:mRNA interferase YafQ